jgi:predicted nucleic acid-binding protein
MKIFLDTNIFLDLILKRENYKESLLILNAVSKGIFDAFILDITLLNIDYIAKKQVKEVRTFLNEVNKNFTVLGANNSIFSKALELNQTELEDNVQYISAKASHCELIITNDQKFYSPDITTFSSQGFIDKYLK